MQKHKITKKLKTIAVPESLWQIIRTEAAKKGIKIYEEIVQKYEQK